MKKGKGFPEVLYVKWEDDQKDQFLHASAEPKELAELDGQVTCGLYRLECTCVVQNKTTLELDQ